MDFQNKIHVKNEIDIKGTIDVIRDINFEQTN